MHKHYRLIYYLLTIGVGLHFLRQGNHGHQVFDYWILWPCKDGNETSISVPFSEERVTLHQLIRTDALMPSIQTLDSREVEKPKAWILEEIYSDDLT